MHPQLIFRRTRSQKITLSCPNRFLAPVKHVEMLTVWRLTFFERQRNERIRFISQVQFGFLQICLRGLLSYRKKFHRPYMLSYMVSI